MPCRKICAAALCMMLLMPSAMALYPIDMQTMMNGSAPEIRKTYELTAEDDPDSIPREAFILGGVEYTFFELMKSTPEPAAEMKDYEESMTVTSKSRDMETVLSVLPAEKECTTEDGYAGTLKLDVSTIETEVAGYGSSSKKISVTRSYPNLASADLQNIPKTSSENGSTLTLADVEWQSDNTANVDGFALTDRYTAIATYTGTKSSSYVTGYNITATYSGVLMKTHAPVTRYTAIFLGKEIPPAAEDEAAEPVDAPIPWESFALPIGCLLVCMGVLALLFNIRKIRSRFRKEKKREESISEIDSGLSDDDSALYPGIGDHG